MTLKRCQMRYTRTPDYVTTLPPRERMEFGRHNWTPLYYSVLLLLLKGYRNIDIIRELNVSRSAVQRAIADMAGRVGIDSNVDSKQVGLVLYFYVPEDRRPGDDLEITWHEVWGERTPHQLQVWQFVMKNLKIRLIAEQVGISENAVQNELQIIFDQAGMCSRLELVLWTLSHEPPQVESAVNSAT